MKFISAVDPRYDLQACREADYGCGGIERNGLEVSASISPADIMNLLWGNESTPSGGSLQVLRFCPALSSVAIKETARIYRKRKETLPRYYEAIRNGRI